MRGSLITSQSITFPSLLKYFSRSLLVTRVDRPVTYKLFPGLLACTGSLLLLRERLLSRDNDLDMLRLRGDNDLDWLRPRGDGETECEVYLEKWKKKFKIDVSDWQNF